MIAVLLGGIAALVATEATRPLRVHRTRSHRPPISIDLVRRAAIGLGVVAGAVLAPPLLVLVPAAWWATREWRRHQAQRAHERAVRQALPGLVDLLRLATTAGLALAVAHPVVAPHVSAPLGPALLDASVAATSGRPRADALLEALAPFGERAHALAHVLSDHLRYGVPLLPGLERAGLELRLDRRRAAELDARRVPVRLLGPLVTCVLPAFALLTVVPLLAASLEALPL